MKYDKTNNPFEYGEARKMGNDMIMNYFIEDNNYSRFLLSNKNIFLRGERGTGKSMTLLFHSFDVQHKKREGEGLSVDFSKIGVYIECNTQLYHKPEHKIFEDVIIAKRYSEALFVLDIGIKICDTLINVSQYIPDFLIKQVSVKKYLEYIFSEQLNLYENVFKSLKCYFNKLSKELQEKSLGHQELNKMDKTFSFSSTIIPIFNSIDEIEELINSHFLIMIDDAQFLSSFQNEALNSWIAYRDHSKFSFKVASTKVEQPPLNTSTGIAILSGHDFIELDIEFYEHNIESYKILAKDIIERRLRVFEIKQSADEFFPINENMKNDLEKCKIVSKEKALTVVIQNPNESETDWKKRLSNYVSKNYRVEYFRQRPAKANNPPYSGFDTIVHLSTGVIRNLLEPCFFMYDRDVSDLSEKALSKIEPETQSEIILSLSNKKWNFIKTDLETKIPNCTREMACYIDNLFENLAKLFQYRLLHHNSEPRALMFTITGDKKFIEEKLEPIFKIAREATLLYTRLGVAKKESTREIYYIPNKMLWPIKGLDPVGQYARVSLKAKEIYEAAVNNISFSTDESEDNNQLKLFNN